MEISIQHPPLIGSLTLFLVIGLTACIAQSTVSEIPPEQSAAPVSAKSRPFPVAPATPDEAVSPEHRAVIESAVASFKDGDSQAHFAALAALGASGDPRVGWLLSDFLRLSTRGGHASAVIASADSLLGIAIDRSDSWSSLTDHLIAWDVPELPGYLAFKRDLFIEIVPDWERLMVEGGEVDWRHVSWGGVGIDDRPYDQTHRRVNSIPAVDNPEVTDAAGGDWLEDDAPVFGVVINGEARAYPRFIMEIREMVNDSLGGRDFAVPYCTLCGAAHVWFTDRLPARIERPVLRSSGLLIRSNKLMYDVVTGSVFDTFLGRATNGALFDAGITLQGHTIISTTWAEWKKAHPHTTVLSEKEALGRRSDLRRTRDADGPIFPVGDVDPRLSVQEEVLGVISPSGSPLAFPVNAVRRALASGGAVSLSGVNVRSDSGGLAAFGDDGKPLIAHESFWFGWSQFRPDTAVWSRSSEGE